MPHDIPRENDPQGILTRTPVPANFITGKPGFTGSQQQENKNKHMAFHIHN
jgi:hypothetical protein